MRLAAAALAIVAGVSLALAAGCRRDKAKESAAPGSTGDDPPPPTPAALELAGALRLVDGAAESLAAYAINAVTLGPREAVSACRLPVQADGAFTASCPGFYDVPWGGFLQRTEADGSVTTAAVLLFDAAGAPVSTIRIASARATLDITFDPAAGAAVATVAREGEAPAGTPEVRSGRGIGGLWRATCVEDAARGLGCEAASSLPPELYFGEASIADVPVVGVWESEAHHARCMQGGSTEALPLFAIRAPDRGAVELRATEAELVVALDRAFDELPAQVKARLHDKLAATAARVAAECDRLAAEGNPYTAGNCRLVDAPGAAQDYAGAVTAGTTECWLVDEVAELPFCPFNASPHASDPNRGRVAVSLAANGKPLTIECVAPYAVALSPASTKAAALELLTEEFERRRTLAGAATACATVSTPTSPFAGARVGEARAYRSLLYRILAADAEATCGQFLGEGFAFDSCGGAAAESGPCRAAADVAAELALAIDATKGTLVATGAAPGSLPAGFARDACPQALKSSAAGFSGRCRAEFLAASAATQAAQLLALARERDEVASLLCQGGSVGGVLTATATASCLPELSFERTCIGAGVCSDVRFECGGEGGAQCYPAEGRYDGEVRGRLALLTRTDPSGDTFDLAGQRSLSFDVWDPFTEASQQCVAVRATALAGVFEPGADRIAAVLARRSRLTCRERYGRSAVSAATVARDETVMQGLELSRP